MATCCTQLPPSGFLLPAGWGLQPGELCIPKKLFTCYLACWVLSNPVRSAFEKADLWLSDMPGALEPCELCMERADVHRPVLAQMAHLRHDHRFMPQIVSSAIWNW
jgi:hypothetical protein